MNCRLFILIIGPVNSYLCTPQLRLLKGQYERFLKESKRKNILVVGDFNATPASPELAFMLEGGSASKFVCNLPKEVFSHPAEAPRWRIDYMLPNENMQPELLKGSLQVKYFFDKEKQAQLADHLPLVADFATRER